MLNSIKSQTGAATLIAAIIIASGVLSVVLSATIIALNDRVSLTSFGDSVQSFYAAEAGVGESLMQLRKDPNNLIFDDFIVADLNVSSEFVEGSGASSIIEATASTTKATRKVRYTCSNNISSCLWQELTP